MKLAKKAKLLILLLFAVVSLSCCIAKSVEKPENIIEIVESVPVETELGNPAFSNTVDAWTNMIDSAEKTLDIETFYIAHEEGEPLEKVLDSIRKAAGRGVRVRIISDSVFYKTYPEPLDSLGKTENITVKIIPFSKHFKGIMHAKFFVADGSSVFMGSQNFDWRAMNQIQEMGIILRNREIAGEFQRIFDLDWALCDAENRDQLEDMLKAQSEKSVNSKNPVVIGRGKSAVKIHPAFSPTGFIFEGQDLEEDEIVRLIKKAKKQILIKVMSYTPIPRNKTKANAYYGTLDNALREAAARGVNVKMMVSNWSTGKKTPYLKSLACFPGIEIKISAIPQASAGFISFARVDHSKYMLIDDNTTFISTSNWEQSYFHDCRDAAVIVESTDLNHEMQKTFFKSWDSKYAEEIDLMKDYKEPKTFEKGNRK